jgi:peptidoglycan/xylan/chitin deacetylase (PgdA/CDA1 family)
MQGLRPRRGTIVALAYHAIADLGTDPVLARWSVHPRDFAAQLDAFASSGWTFVDLDLVLAVQRGEREPPSRALLLTFDDAYTDLLDAALPVLRRHGAPGVVFAVADQLGGTNSWDQPAGARPLPLLDAAGLREAIAGGFELGSHSTHHRPLTAVPEGELDEEIAGSAERLLAAGLPRPRSFAYPHGDCDERIAATVSAADYELAFTIRPGVIAPGSDLFQLPRVAVLGGDTPRSLAVKAATAAWPERWRIHAQRLLRIPR